MHLMRTHATKLGPWTLTERIALGGSAEVYLAEGEPGTVALKVPRNPRGRDALVHEAEILGRLDHKGIPKLVRTEPRGAWLAMEYVPGMPLTTWAAERPLEEVVQVLLRLLAVLGYLHGERLVHGDLTPGNVLVRPDGEAVLIDLGLAAGMDETVPTGFRGTLGYAAPELLKGGLPTEAADLYGFGAVAYAALTGAAPFRPSDPAALAYIPLVTVPMPPSSLRPALAGPIDEIILNLLARDPEQRPHDLRAIGARLWEGSDSSHGTPVLGMAELRDQLRRVALEVIQGETRIVVLYGPPGSGRTALAAEIVEVACREGAEVSDGEHAEFVGEGPIALTTDASPDRAEILANAAAKADRPVLLILCTDRPNAAVRALGALEVTPPPLGRSDTVRLAVSWGAPEELAERWWRDSFGHPVSVHGKLRAWLRTQGRKIGDDHLSKTAKAILEMLRNDGSSRLSDLARALRMGEHELLDHSEVLFAEGLVESANDGAELRLKRKA